MTKGSRYPLGVQVPKARRLSLRLEGNNARGNGADRPHVWTHTTEDDSPEKIVIPRELNLSSYHLRVSLSQSVYWEGAD